MDAEKLKNKDSRSVLKAFQKIYARDILKMPHQLELDAGGEFKGEVKAFFDEHNVRIRYALTNSHRQEALVERKNQILGTLIHKIQAHKELQTGKVNKQWIKVLPELVDHINDHSPKPITKEISPWVISNNYNKKLLEIGQRIRIKLDYPISLQGKKLIGKFRDSDIKWSPEIYTIKQVLLKPGMVPEYLTSKTNERAYSKEMLQPVSAHFV